MRGRNNAFLPPIHYYCQIVVLFLHLFTIVNNDHNNNNNNNDITVIIINVI